MCDNKTLQEQELQNFLIKVIEHNKFYGKSITLCFEVPLSNKPNNTLLKNVLNDLGYSLIYEDIKQDIIRFLALKEQ